MGCCQILCYSYNKEKEVLKDAWALWKCFINRKPNTLGLWTMTYMNSNSIVTLLAGSNIFVLNI